MPCGDEGDHQIWTIQKRAPGDSEVLFGDEICFIKKYYSGAVIQALLEQPLQRVLPHHERRGSVLLERKTGLGKSRVVPARRRSRNDIRKAAARRLAPGRS